MMMTRSSLTILLFPILALAASVDDWPRWRGPMNNGVARGDVPAEFSESKNIAWKLDIPGRGFSSPVMWGGKLFVTTAVPLEAPATTAASAPAAAGGAENAGQQPPAQQQQQQRRGGPGGGAGAGGVEYKFMVMAIDAKTGKVIWERVAKTAKPHEGYHARYGSFASNSPVTDGKHVIAFFGSRGLYCYDLDGKLVWQKQFDPMRMRLQFGEGSAAVLHGNRLLLNFDQESGSFILALDKATGKEVWRKERDEVSSWAPPFVVKVDGREQVILPASAKVRAYDFETGELIWECAGLGSNVIPSPVAVDDNKMVIVMSGHREPNLLAIKLGRKGDLTGTDAVVWTNQRGNSYTPSPVLHEGKLYMLTDNGMLSCLEAATGKAHYSQQRLPQPYNFKASPIAANGKLYLSAENGDVIVVKMGEKFEILATNSFPDHMFIASPAVSDGSLYLRSHKSLFCVRQAK